MVFRTNYWAGVLCVLALAGITSAVPIPGLYNTGVDDSHNPLPGGALDSHWTLAGSADASYPGPQAYVVMPSAYPLASGDWIANDSVSQWLSPRADGGHLFPRTIDCTAGNTAPCESADYAYETTFDLTGLDSATAVITGRWSSDDAGVLILLNGVSTGITYPHIDGGNYHAWSDTFTIDSGFVAGLNTLTVIARNWYFPDCGTSDNPTGVRVELAGSVEVPEPVSLALLTLGSGALLGLRRRR